MSIRSFAKMWLRYGKTLGFVGGKERYEEFDLNMNP